MKNTICSKFAGAFVVLMASGLLLTMPASAQTDYYFDPGASATGTGSGGNGTWDTNVTSDWFLPGSGDTTFPAGAAGNANFEGVGGTVSVVGSVDPHAINFDGSSAYAVNAGTLGSIDEGTANNLNIVNTGTGVTLHAPITFSGGTGNINMDVNNTGTGVFNFGSTVTNTDTSGTPQNFHITFDGGTSEFSGNILGTSNGTEDDSGDPTNDNIIVDGNATLLVDNGNFNRFIVNSGGSLLTHGAANATPVNVIGTDSIAGGGSVIGGGTAAQSYFSGVITNFGGARTFTAAAGGRVDFTGDIVNGGVGAGSNQIIEAAGIVAFSAANGNEYAVQYNGGSNTAVGTEVENGTLLLENTNRSTSATGNGINQNDNGTHGASSIGANNVVQVDNVTNPTTAAPIAVLGGFGFSYQQVVAMGVHSTITPGDISMAGVVTPGTLHLLNGLTAANGLTANFTLTGTPATSSMVELESTSINPQNGNFSNGAVGTALTLDGPIDINLSGTINTSDTYTLFYSTTGTTWDLSGANYAFTGAPAGYAANVLYVANDGSGHEALDVDFTVVLEPSTWLMIGLGGLVLIGTGKFRRLHA